MALPNYVKFYRGTPAAFNKLTSKDNNTLYFIAENGATKGQLYLGNKLISGSDASDINLGDLGNVNLEGVINNDILSYDSASGEWIATSLEVLLAQIPSLGESAVYEGVTGEGEDHAAAIARLVGANTPKKGDITIIKDFIAKNPKDGEDKYQYTSYVYNGSTWAAMDGNYNAENVYFDEDLLTTSAIGNITLTNGQATIAATGKNLKEVFETIFVKEKNPSVTQPSLTVTLSNAGEYEVGTEITPSYTTSFSAGKYTYGPSTGVTATSYSITDTNGGSSEASSGSFAKFTIEDDTDYSVSGSVNHTAGATPVTNTGNPVASLAIKEGSKNGASSSITGFRRTFYGAIDAKSNVDSALIRSLAGKSDTALANGAVFNVDVNVGALRVVIAYPAALRDLTSIQDNNDSMANIISSFTKTTVDVEGLNGADAISYKVYYIDFANAYDAANKFTVTI